MIEQIEGEKPITMALRIPAELAAKVADAARIVRLKRADVARLALERGIEILLQQMAAPVAVAVVERGAA